MREITTLSWPTAPYSTAHRPVQRTTRLLTGIAVSAPADHDPPHVLAGWALAHIPVHRTRALPASGSRVGVHAAVESAPGEPRCWAVLDQVLLAGRRQAVALAAVDLTGTLERAVRRARRAGARPGRGLASLLDDSGGPAPGTATLLDLDPSTVDDGCRALLSAHPLRGWTDIHPHASSQDPMLRFLAGMITHATAVAWAAGALTGRLELKVGPDGHAAADDLLAVLDQEAGDVLLGSSFRDLGTAR